jgi:glutamate formiminotransferase
MMGRVTITTGGPLLECVPNVSEGRDPRVIEALADAVRRVGEARLVNVHSDPDHHRSVFTILGPPPAVEAAALALAEAVVARVDMRGHRGVHPRMGALDVVPFVPLRGLTMADAVAAARRVGEALARAHALPVYLYGAAAMVAGRTSQSAVRAGQYEALPAKLADPAWRPDFGPARFNPRLGASAVGARDVLVAYNVWLDSTDVGAARAIAGALRESSGGLPAVQAMGFPLERRHCAQVSMNLLDYRRTGLARAWDAVGVEAGRRGIPVTRGELVGLAPRAAFEGRAPAGVGLPDLTAADYLETHLGSLSDVERAG